MGPFERPQVNRRYLGDSKEATPPPADDMYPIEDMRRLVGGTCMGDVETLKRAWDEAHLEIVDDKK